MFSRAAHSALQMPVGLKSRRNRKTLLILAIRPRMPCLRAERLFYIAAIPNFVPFMEKQDEECSARVFGVGLGGHVRADGRSRSSPSSWQRLLPASLQPSSGLLPGASSDLLPPASDPLLPGSGTSACLLPGTGFGLPASLL